MQATALKPRQVLRKPKGIQKKIPVAWRLEQDLVEYLQKAAEGRRGAQTELVEDALRVQRDMGELLAPDLERLKRFALDLGLDLHENEAEVIAKAVRLALDAHGKRK
jgi:hypothetical protein